MGSSREELHAQVELVRVADALLIALSQQHSYTQYLYDLLKQQDLVYKKLVSLPTYIHVINELKKFIIAQQIERGYDLRCLAEFENLPASSTELFYREAFTAIEEIAEEFIQEYHVWSPVYFAYQAANDIESVLFDSSQSDIHLYHRKLVKQLYLLLPTNYSRSHDRAGWKQKFDKIIDEKIGIKDKKVASVYDQFRQEVKNTISLWIQSDVKLSDWEQRYRSVWNSNDSEDEDEASPSSLGGFVYQAGTVALLMSQLAVTSAKKSDQVTDTQGSIVNLNQVSFSKFSNHLAANLGTWQATSDKASVIENIKLLSLELNFRPSPTPALHAETENKRENQIQGLRDKLSQKIHLTTLIESLALRLSNLTDKFPDRIVLPYVWDEYNNLDYQHYRLQIESEFIALQSEVMIVKKVLADRASAEHIAVDNIKDELLVAKHKQTLLAIRKHLHKAEKILATITFTMGNDILGLPTEDKLEEYGLHTKPVGVGFSAGELKRMLAPAVPVIGLSRIRKLASHGAREASVKLGDCYAKGKYVVKDLRVAKIFYRQALTQKKDYITKDDIRKKLIDLDASVVLVKCKSVVQEYRTEIFKTKALKNYAKLDNKEDLGIGLQDVPRRTFAPDSNDLADLAHFNIEAIINPRKVTPELVARLKIDIQRIFYNYHEKFSAYLSAILDDEYSSAPIIAYYYAKHSDRWLSLQWFTLAADHGHVHAMYVVGKAYTFGYQSAAGKVEFDIDKGKIYLYQAAKHGNAQASRLLARTTTDRALASYYLYQAQLQDPFTTVTEYVDDKQDDSLAKSVRARGLSPISHDHQSEPLEWFAVPRNESNIHINHLWQMFKEHRTDKSCVESLYQAFKENQHSCFFAIAEFYRTSGIKTYGQHTAEALSSIWAMLGFRSGDIDAAVIFGEYAIRLDYLRAEFHEPLTSIIKETYAAVSLHMTGYAGLGRGEADKTLEQFLTPLGHEALLFASYYHHPRAPLLLANLRMMDEGQFSLSAMARSRAYFAQAVISNDAPWVSFFNYASVTTTFYRVLIDEIKANKAHTASSWITQYYQMTSMREDLLLAIKVARNKLLYNFESDKQLLVKSTLNTRLSQLDELRALLENGEHIPTISWFTKLGVRMPLVSRPVVVDDELVRVRDEWEWQDIIPELIEKDFDNTQQPRTITLSSFPDLNHPLLQDLNQSYLKNPEDMLAIRNFCSAMQREDLAELWLKHAANMGDRIANRILALRSVNPSQVLKVVAAHGDAVASQWLANQSGVNAAQRGFLENQAALWVQHSKRRSLHLNGHLRLVPSPTSSTLSWTYFFITLPVGGFVWGINKFLQWKTARHVSALKSESERVKNIDRQQAYLSKVSFIDFTFNEKTQCFTSVLNKQPKEVALKMTSANDIMITELDTSSTEMLLSGVIDKLKAMKILHVKSNHDKSIKGLLSLLDLRLNKNILLCTEQFVKGKVELACADRIAILLAYLELGGFRQIEMVDDLDGNCHISIRLQPHFKKSDIEDYLCVRLFDKSLRLHYELQIQHQEREKIKLHDTQVYKQRLNSAIHLVQRLMKEMQVQSSSRQSSHFFIVDLREELNVKIREVNEEKLGINPGRVIRAAKDLLNICHKLIGYEASNSYQGLFGSLLSIQSCIDLLESDLNCQANEMKIIDFANDFQRMFSLIAEDGELQKTFDVYYKEFYKFKHQGLRKLSSSSSEDSQRKLSCDDTLSLSSSPHEESCEEVKVALISQPKKRRSLVAEKPELSIFSSEINIKFKGFLASLLNDRYKRLLVLFKLQDQDLLDIPLLRQRALHFRLLRLQLVLELLNQKDFYHLPVNSALRDEQLGTFFRNWGHSLMHNNCYIEWQDLQACVMTCYLLETQDKQSNELKYVPRKINTDMVMLIKETALFRKIFSERDNIIIPRTCQELIDDLRILCGQLAELRQTCNGKLDQPYKRDLYHDACRMTLMCIGEVGQRLHEFNHHLRDRLNEKNIHLTPLYNFICQCKDVRNADRHVDLCFENVRDMHTRSELSVYLENFSVAKIMKLSGMGIRFIRDSPILFDELLVAMNEISQQAPPTPVGLRRG